MSLEVNNKLEKSDSFINKSKVPLVKVKAVWEFEVDTEDFDEEFVDIIGLAKDLTKTEMKSMLDNNELSEEDFTYEVAQDSTISDTKIGGIIFEHGNDDYGLWEGFCLSEEDENAIYAILSKYDMQGCSVRGTRKDIAEEFV